jgi:hypothetical protein
LEQGPFDARRRSRDTPGLSLLLELRVLRPSYSFLLATRFCDLFRSFPRQNDAALFERMREIASATDQPVPRQLDAVAAVVRVMIRTGKEMARTCSTTPGS